MEWINISEKIPDTYKDVLVWNETFNMHEIRHRLNEEYPDCQESHNRYVWNAQGIFNNIRWWMPLPEPPN